MTRVFNRTSLLALALLIGWLAGSARAATLTSALDRDTTAVGESVTLTLTFEGGATRAAPIFPAIANLTIAYAGQSSQFSFVNGQARQTLTHSYLVTASQPGDYVIPAIRTTVDGRPVQSLALKLKVLKGGTQPDGIGSLAFLKLQAPKTTVFVGEIFPVELALYIQSGKDLQMPQLSADGFTLGKMEKPIQTRTQIGNLIYNVLTFKTAAKAIKSGALTLGPAQCTVAVQVPRTRRTDLFDLFNDRAEYRHVTLNSESAAMTVLPLPTTNQPPSFSGAVGRYSMTASATPTEVNVGDPITVKVQINGHGALDALNLPAQENWREFKTYPPSSQVEAMDEQGLHGTKTFTQHIIPQNADIKMLPEFSFSYFDPDQKKYVTLKQPPIPLTIHPGAALQLPPANLANTAGPNQEAPPLQDIVHIKPSLGSVATLGVPLIQRPWFVALQGLPLLAWLAAFVWRKRADSLANNPRLRRQRQVAQTIQAGLAELKNLAAQDRSEEFFALLFRLLQEQLGERLNLPASAITEAVIDEHLRPRGVKEEVLAGAHELFQICNQARYARVQTAQQLQALVPQVETTLRTLQKVEPGI